MGKAIIGVIIVAFTVVGWTYLWYWIGLEVQDARLKKDGDLGIRGRELLRRASQILGSIGASPSIDDPEIIRSVTRVAITNWFKDYHKENKTK